MSIATRLLASTLGRVAPRYRTFGQWCDIYREILAGRPISEKTLANRRSVLKHLEDGLGDRTISSIRPHEVSAVVQRLGVAHPQRAKRVLFEARDAFNEAVNYGWIDRNPASPVKVPVVRVARKRLTLEQWKKIHAWSVAHQPPWVSRMLVLALVTGQRRSDLAKMQFADVWDNALHVEQVKTGTRIALPLNLRLDALDTTLGQAIEGCLDYAGKVEYLLRKHNGEPLVLASLSARFEEAREGAGVVVKDGNPPSLHECRSLSERLYREQGINTMVLLGHKHQAMTDLYNDDRGLSKGKWQTLEVV